VSTYLQRFLPQFCMQSFCLQPSHTCAELPYRILAFIGAFDWAASP